jgi:hypothetical protein
VQPIGLRQDFELVGQGVAENKARRPAPSVLQIAKHASFNGGGSPTRHGGFVEM